MQKANQELVESLHQFLTVWKLIGKPFPKRTTNNPPCSRARNIYLRLGYHPTVKFRGCMLGPETTHSGSLGFMRPPARRPRAAQQASLRQNLIGAGRE